MALKSRVLDLTFAWYPTLSNKFSKTILTKLEIFLANRDTPLIDKLAIFFFFINVAWIEKILRAKVTPWPSFPYSFSSNWVSICVFSRYQLIPFLMLDFNDLGFSIKITMPIFRWHRFCRN
jgi:hypothetical protein